MVKRDRNKENQCVCLWVCVCVCEREIENSKSCCKMKKMVIMAIPWAITQSNLYGLSWPLTNPYIMASVFDTSRNLSVLSDRALWRASVWSVTASLQRGGSAGCCPSCSRLTLPCHGPTRDNYRSAPQPLKSWRHSCWAGTLHSAHVWPTVCKLLLHCTSAAAAKESDLEKVSDSACGSESMAKPCWYGHINTAFAFGLWALSAERT